MGRNIESHAEGYRYSRFCEPYRGWASRLSVTMRQAHAGGDKLLVDYVGNAVSVIVTWLTRPGPSGTNFCRCHRCLQFQLCRGEPDPNGWPTESAPIPSAFAAIGEVPKLLVSDNTKIALIKACLSKSQVNRTYAEMMVHYDTAMVPGHDRGGRGTTRRSKSRC